LSSATLKRIFLPEEKLALQESDTPNYLTLNTTMLLPMMTNAHLIFEKDLLSRTAIKRSASLRRIRKQISNNIVFEEHSLENASVQAAESTVDFCNFRPFRPYFHRSLIGRHTNATPQNDQLLQLVEDLFIFHYGLVRARNLPDRLVVLATYAKLRVSKLSGIAVFNNIVTSCL
jgi:hypothetical protein